MYYLQKYPHKTASFLGYLYYLSKQSAKLNIQGLVKLDSELRTQYVNNPGWLWTQDKFTIIAAADDVKDKPYYRNLKNNFHQNFNQSSSNCPTFQSRGGKSSGPSFKTRQPPRELSQEHIDELKSQHCGKWNTSSCTRRDCLRQHNCWFCVGPTKTSLSKPTTKK